MYHTCWKKGFQCENLSNDTYVHTFSYFLLCVCMFFFFFRDIALHFYKIISRITCPLTVIIFFCQSMGIT